MNESFDLPTYLEERRKRVDAALDSALPSYRGEAHARDRDPGRLREGMRYAVLQGGKRMRPMLAIAACEAVGGTLDQALPPCCAIEMVHAYSLVHDDLPAMDNDLERRGQPTVHVAFGEASAILIGDALLTAAFGVLARGLPQVSRSAAAEAVVKLAHHAGVDGMVGGQCKDLELGQDIVELEILEQVHALKTGGLYAAAAAMGALFGGAQEADVAALERYGLAFGVAFQHADDVLDDDQPSLRESALMRTDQLVAQCCDIAAKFGPKGLALDALARWVQARARRAAAGDRRD